VKYNFKLILTWNELKTDTSSCNYGHRIPGAGATVKPCMFHTDILLMLLRSTFIPKNLSTIISVFFKQGA
jgi:hypothetical protein